MQQVIIVMTRLCTQIGCGNVHPLGNDQWHFFFFLIHLDLGYFVVKLFCRSFLKFMSVFLGLKVRVPIAPKPVRWHLG